MGLSKYAPPSVSIQESTRLRPRVTAPAPPGRACHTRPRSALVVLRHLDGLLLLDRLGLLHPMPTLGFAAFHPVAKQGSPRHIPALQSLAPRCQQRPGPPKRPEPRVIVSGLPTLPPCSRSPVTLPPRRCVVTPLALRAGRDREAFLRHRSRGVPLRCRAGAPDALLGLLLLRCRLSPRPDVATGPCPGRPVHIVKDSYVKDRSESVSRSELPGGFPTVAGL
jgi:hypothetical protein